jgi:hypothetical protein
VNIILLNVILLNVILLNVILLNVILLNVILLKAILLNVLKVIFETVANDLQCMALISVILQNVIRLNFMVASHIPIPFSSFKNFYYFFPLGNNFTVEPFGTAPRHSA